MIWGCSFNFPSPISASRNSIFGTPILHFEGDKTNLWANCGGPIIASVGGLYVETADEEASKLSLLDLFVDPNPIVQSYDGILNYARTYTPNLSSKLGPLYEKTSPHGDKRMKSSDWALVKEIKAQVNNLPNLEIPPENAYIVLETDGSMTGWGGVCKWKPNKYDPEIWRNDTFSKNFLKKEHEKRNRMAKIEDEAIGNVLECLRELELILHMKEFDFNRRRHAEGGWDSYYHKNLEKIRKHQKDLFIEMQRVQQIGHEVKAIPP
ncbi:hypothetical protein ZIOFF_007094 [Zingiber officinale]|uniref:Uncharacterized protein n=1 Tax=Zingiber officinale TaxID=94328 RepID=A0A8J5HT56_ZINOF|nr:hypothetical protein ZIOFF_007094 [Zingiber officinale]